MVLFRSRFELLDGDLQLVTGIRELLLELAHERFLGLGGLEVLWRRVAEVAKRNEKQTFRNSLGERLHGAADPLTHAVTMDLAVGGDGLPPLHRLLQRGA